ncbi:hypothetical protein D3C87_256150 [compost metagenome]
MSYNNFNIKYKDHFILFVELKDKVIFESELSRNNIVYHIDDNQSTLDNTTRYFLLNDNKASIDEIIINNGIVANTGSTHMADFNDQKKVMRLYGLIAAAIALIIILITLFED